MSVIIVRVRLLRCAELKYASMGMAMAIVIVMGGGMNIKVMLGLVLLGLSLSENACVCGLILTFAMECIAIVI